MRSLLVGALAALAAACVAKPEVPSLPRFELPEPYTDQGLEVRVTGYSYIGSGPGRAIDGFVGTARNTTGEALGTVMLIFDVLDESGVVLEDAIATTPSLSAKGRWRFRATVTALQPKRVARIEPREVRVVSKLER